MNGEYFILEPDGSQDGPYGEEELLDLMDQGELSPGTRCMDADSGRITRLGKLFHVVAPPAPAPVPWKPAPFPRARKDDEEEDGAPSAAREPAPGRPRARLLYHGSPCVLTYWRSALLAVVLFAGGWLAREKMPALLALGPLAGMGVLLYTVLRRMRSRYIVTTTRVELRRFAGGSRVLAIREILAIRVKRSGFPGLLGIGTVIFASATGPARDVVFPRVWRASALRDLVSRLQEAAQLSPGSSGIFESR